MQQNCKKVGFIGGGNMAKAICTAIVNRNLVDYRNVYVSGPHVENLTYWKERNANVTTENVQVVINADVIFLAVKPQMLSKAIEQIFIQSTSTSASSNIKKTQIDCSVEKVYVSIVAGVTLDALHDLLRNATTCGKVQIIRAMPNTPMMCGVGCTFIAFKEGTVDLKHVDCVQRLLEAGGICHIVSETLINSAGCLSGSGPAFVYLFIEALSDGAVRMGLTREIATKVAAQTVLGAATMVLQTGRHPAVLKDEVCSAGGTTIAGLHALEIGGVRGAVMNALEAGTNRARELGGLSTLSFK